jgi:hypothetical protein
VPNLPTTTLVSPSKDMRGCLGGGAVTWCFRRVILHAELSGISTSLYE